MKNHNRTLVSALMALAFAAAAPAQADEPRSHGPGMMGGGYGPGMMGGYGPGQGAYGPGMMGGYGPGHGYGPGMMGGYGPGQGAYGGGMMGGGMMGSGMMGSGGPIHMLDLSDQQRSQINQIQDDTRRKNWGVMGKLMDERAQMRDLMQADKRDPAAIGKQSMKIADLRRQLLEARIDAHNRMEALLTKDQREQLRANHWQRPMMSGD